jgi:hypothetical protein
MEGNLGLGTLALNHVRRDLLVVHLSVDTALHVVGCEFHGVRTTLIIIVPHAVLQAIQEATLGLVMKYAAIGTHARELVVKRAVENAHPLLIQIIRIK